MGNNGHITFFWKHYINKTVFIRQNKVIIEFYHPQTHKKLLPCSAEDQWEILCDIAIPRILSSAHDTCVLKPVPQSKTMNLLSRKVCKLTTQSFCELRCHDVKPRTQKENVKLIKISFQLNYSFLAYIFTLLIINRLATLCLKKTIFYFLNSLESATNSYKFLIRKDDTQGKESFTSVLKQHSSNYSSYKVKLIMPFKFIVI